MRTPRAFVSYSREGDDHDTWVRTLSENLVEAGVQVTLDQWHLNVGSDVDHFMQKAVETADYILAVCTPTYAAKFDSRQAGVGAERDLIRGDLLRSGRLDGRVIPLVREAPASMSVPATLLTKLHIDFSIDEDYEGSVEQLVRRLHNRPKHAPPDLGAPPFEIGDAHHGQPPGPPVSWVLVAGVGWRRGQPNADRYPEKLRETAERLGRLLARDGHGLVTGGWQGVDETVARSFTRALPSSGGALEDRLVQVIAESAEPAYPGGNLVLVPEGREEWMEGIRRSDAVVLIGGLGGTKTTGRMAQSFGKAVFPLADTGGDAKEVYLEMLRDYESKGVPGIERRVFQGVGREAPGVVDQLGDLLGMI